jgi:hypothetical protein
MISHTRLATAVPRGQSELLLLGIYMLILIIIPRREYSELTEVKQKGLYNLLLTVNLLCIKVQEFDRSLYFIQELTSIQCC